jgi:5-methylcytosine-specific restriction protein A
VAAAPIDAEALARSAIGSTIDQGEPNRVLAVAVADGDVVVGTNRSPNGSAVPLAVLQDAADALVRDGEIRVHPDALGHRRSSFVGALLATHPMAVGLVKPQRVRLRGSVPLRPLLERALAIVPQPRTTDALSQHDPVYALIVHELRDAIAGIVADERSYKTEGSVGRGNWAETPWVAVFDLNVTDTATRGYYLVYLFRRDGQSAVLSLCQGTTAVYRTDRRNYEDILMARARAYVGYLGEQSLLGLQLGRVDLGGGRPPLTPGYEAGNIAATTYARDDVPGDEVLERDVQRLLALYRRLVENVDQIQAGEDEPLPRDRQEYEEQRLLRWHQRAEGRNRGAVAEAKRLQGYRCQVCDVDFEQLHGEDGRRCIDAHHLVPFAELGDGPRRLNPLDDFAIVCANCHRLLHSRTPPRSLIDLRNTI